MTQLLEIKVPDIGDFKDVAVIEVMVKVGEVIAVDTGLIMVESDKASMEIPSTHAGRAGIGPEMRHDPLQPVDLRDGIVIRNRKKLAANLVNCLV